MNPDQVKKIHLLYSALLSLLLMATAICFAVSCILICYSGANPFTRARVAEHFSRIAVPVYLTVAAVIGGALLHLFLPTPPTPAKNGMDTEETVQRLSRNLPTELCTEPTRNAIAKERKLRGGLLAANAALYLIGAVFPLIYALNPENFLADDINQEVLYGFAVILTGLFIPFLCSIILLFVGQRSLKREIVLLRQAKSELPASAKRIDVSVKSPPVTVAERNCKVARLVAQSLLLLCGVIFIILGIANGGMSDVLQKAIKICTECVGMG